MDWPSVPVQSRTGPFRPPCCAWRDCPTHRRRRPMPFRFIRWGSYATRKQPHRRIPGFRCKSCERTFSRQTFATTYYLKRPELLLPVAAGLVAGSAHRQIARSFPCAPSTVDGLAERLGDHAIRLQAFLLQQPLPQEPFCLDHFETFELTQDLPFGVATLVGQRSWMAYSFEPAPHRRAGRMSPAQKRRADKRKRTPAFGGYAASFRRCLDLLLACHRDPRRPLELATDDKPDYRRALGRHPERRRFRHRTYPNPPRGPKGSPRSPEARERDEAMFACDLLHALLRHSQAHHHRETIAFGRRLNAICGRLFLFGVWRNFIKRRSERDAKSPTPAMRAGLTDGPWTWERLLARRILPHEVKLPATWRRLYDRRWPTPELGVNRINRRVHAY